MNRIGLKKKVENYWYYYKWHTIFIIPIIITFIFILTPGAEKGNKYLCNVLVQRTHLDDIKRKQLEDKEKVNITLLADSKDQNGIQQKVLDNFKNGKYDVAILDKQVFIDYAKQGYFLQLDDLFKFNNLDNKNLNLIKTDVASQGSQHIYGIELSENKDLQAVGYDMKNKVVGIYANVKENEGAVRFISFLFNNFSK